MHEFTPEVEALAAEILKYSLERLKDDPPLDGPRSAEDLFKEVGNTITAKGLGGHEALQVFTNVLAKAAKIELIDFQGKVIKTYALHADRGHLNLDFPIATGIYLLKLTNGNEQLIQKIIK